MAELLTPESQGFEGPGPIEWTTVAGVPVVTRSFAEFRSGAASLSVTTNVNNAGVQSPLVVPTGLGVAVLGSVWIKSPNGGAFSFYGIATGQATNVLALWTVPADQWFQMRTALPNGAPSYRIYVRQNGGVPHTWFLDDASIDDLYTPVVPPPVYEHTLAGVQAALADAFRNIVGLRVYDFPSDRVEPPAAVLSMPETPYDVTLGGRSDEWSFPLWVLVAKADDKSAYNEMYDYLEAEGPKSIRAMVEADRTLGGACDTAAVVRARPLFATVGGTEFLAIEFTLEVYT